MRVLITGLGGFAGRHLAEHLLLAADSVVWGTVFDAAEIETLMVPPERVISGDLREQSFVESAVDAARPEIIFHLAAQASVAASWDDPWTTLEANVRMTLNLLAAMRKQDAAHHARRLLLISSNEVYGAPAPESLPSSEDAPLAPNNPYATSKMTAELLSAQLAAANGLDIVRMRPFSHLGPAQDERFVAPSFARQVAQIELGVREPVVRVGNLMAERDFCDVRDIVRGYRLAAERGASGAVYNLGSGESHTIAEILDHFVGRASVPLRVERDPDRMRPSDVPRTLCDASRARAELGWQPEIPFTKTLDDVLDYARARVAAELSAQGHHAIAT